MLLTKCARIKSVLLKHINTILICRTIEVTLSKHAVHFASCKESSNNQQTTLLKKSMPSTFSDNTHKFDIRGSHTTAASGQTAAPSQQSTQTKVARAHKHQTRVFVLVLFVLACIGYIGAGMYFTNHLMYRTTLNGHDVSCMDAKGLTQYLDDELNAYSIHVSGLNFDMTLDQSQLNLSVDTAACAQNAIEQTAPGFKWPLSLIQPQQVFIEEAPTFDNDATQALINEQVQEFNKNATNPVNAYSQYNPDEQAFTIKDAQVGSALDAKAVGNSVMQDIYALRAESVLDENVLLQPTLTAQDPDLIAINDKANKALELSIPLMHNQEQVGVVDKTLLSQWMHVADPKTLTIDQSAVETWGKDNLQVKSKNAGDINKVNYEKLNELLTQAVCNLDSKEITIPVKVLHATPKGAPAETPGARDRGRHVDINLSTQYARLYDEAGDILWESWFVSGSLASNHSTPTGSFNVTTKARNQTLIGDDTNHDGEPDYKSHVDYWMPFIGNMVGMHDAPWRSAFGGSIYKSNGSHGCVNLPPSKAAELYSLVHVGDPVIVHW